MVLGMGDFGCSILAVEVSVESIRVVEQLVEPILVGLESGQGRGLDMEELDTEVSVLPLEPNLISG